MIWLNVCDFDLHIKILFVQFLFPCIQEIVIVCLKALRHFEHIYLKFVLCG